MDKLGWVLLPIALGAIWVAWRALRGRAPSRQTLNVASSLLLLAYLAATAGLGIFWVANQHLPVFDWHYLFGYALVGLVVLHLAFNLRAVVQHLRRRAPAPAGAVPGRRPALGWLGFAGAAAAGGLGWFVGLRQGRSEWRLAPTARSAGGAAAGGDAIGAPPGAAATADALALVEQFHARSSHSRTAAIVRAPSVAWDDGPPPFKPLPAAEQVPLPPPRARPLPVAAQRLDAAALGVLLWHTVGVSAVRGGLHLRTAPSSGALFATELCVAVRRVDGLVPGIWHYAPQRHALVRLRPGRIDDAALGLPAGATEAPAVVVATAVFRRSGRKYGDRTYRYVLADLGHALENLRVAAQALGADGRIAPRFDGRRAAAAIGVDEAEEGVLALVAIEPAAAVRAPAATPPGSAAQAGGEAAVGWAPPPWQAAVDAPLGITDAVHRATSLRGARVPAAPAAPAVPAVPVPDAAAAGGAPGLVLPPVAAARADRLEVIAHRRSQRRHAAQALPLADLAAVLDAMSGPAPQLSAAVRIHLLTPAVQGLPPRVWRWDPPARALRPAGEPDHGLRRRARAAALDQDVVGDAAAVLVLGIDRAAFAADPAGPARGYRHAFLEAGLIGERAYLEGGARGLAVCAVGAFFDDEAARLVAVDPAREWVVHFVALGVPG